MGELLMARKASVSDRLIDAIRQGWLYALLFSLFGTVERPSFLTFHKRMFNHILFRYAALSAPITENNTAARRLYATMNSESTSSQSAIASITLNKGKANSGLFGSAFLSLLVFPFVTISCNGSNTNISAQQIASGNLHTDIANISGSNPATMFQAITIALFVVTIIGIILGFTKAGKGIPPLICAGICFAGLIFEKIHSDNLFGTLHNSFFNLQIQLGAGFFLSALFYLAIIIWNVNGAKNTRAPNDAICEKSSSEENIDLGIENGSIEEIEEARAKEEKDIARRRVIIVGLLIAVVFIAFYLMVGGHTYFF